MSHLIRMLIHGCKFSELNFGCAGVGGAGLVNHYAENACAKVFLYILFRIRCKLGAELNWPYVPTMGTRRTNSAFKSKKKLKM